MPGGRAGAVRWGLVHRVLLLVALAGVLLVTGCRAPATGGLTSASPPPQSPASATPPAPDVEEAGAAEPPSAAAPAAAPEAAGPTARPTPALPPGVTHPPDWLGQRPLPLRPDGFGEVLPTPPELRDRRFVTTDLLPPPPDEQFAATIDPVPDEVLARSTWTPECPVTRDDLRYVTVSFWGFDQRPHTGELLVHASAAEDVVEVFRRLHQARFPIEQMRIVAAAELDGPPTGDGNVTSAFVCRAVRGGASWSQHAFGLAVDVNPFHNPYQRGDVVLPERASAYLDRSWERPGMLREDGPVVAAFDAIGWGWGGRWRSLDDWMHFSATGR